MSLRAQAVGARPGRPGRAALRALLLRQGNVQLDSVNAVARTHELVPFSRLGRYDPEDLRRVVYRERTMFEYWGHAMSWVPMAEYRYFLPRMEQRRSKPRGWWTGVREQFGPLYAQVLERIRAEGPLGSIDFEDPRDDRGSWWDLKPAKLVLEDLFDQGVLMASDRRSGFQRVYDLAERVIPAHVDLRRPSDDEAACHLLLRAADALGVGTATDLADYFRLDPRARDRGLARVLAAGELVAVAVEGWRDPAFARPGLLNGSIRRPTHPPMLLSPFDPLIWERSRALRLFDFEYRIEIYTPAPKRRYGYYVMPLLVDGALVGRLDVRNDRATRTLALPAVHLETLPTDRLISAIATAARDLAEFLGATQVEVGRTEPVDFRSAVRVELDLERLGEPETTEAR